MPHARRPAPGAVPQIVFRALAFLLAAAPAAFAQEPQPEGFTPGQVRTFLEVIAAALGAYFVLQTVRFLISQRAWTTRLTEHDDPGRKRTARRQAVGLLCGALLGVLVSPFFTHKFLPEEEDPFGGPPPAEKLQQEEQLWEYLGTFMADQSGDRQPQTEAEAAPAEPPPRPRLAYLENFSSLFAAIYGLVGGALGSGVALFVDARRRAGVAAAPAQADAGDGTPAV